MGIIIGAGSTRPTFPYDKYYGIKQTSHSTTTNQSFTAVNNDLMADTARPIWTRIRSFIENNDGSVNYYLDKYDGRYKEGHTATADLTGRDGNAMVEIPAHYRKIEWVGDDFYRLYSDYALPGFEYVPRRVIAKFMATQYTGETLTGALVQNGLVSNSVLEWVNPSYQSINSGDSIMNAIKTAEIATGVNIPAFSDDLLAIAEGCRGGNGSYDSGWDSTYHSMLGMCRTFASRTNFRTWANNVNTAHSITAADKKLHIGTYHIYNELAWLMRTKYLTYDIQNVTAWGGSGTILDASSWSSWGSDRPFIPNGVTLPLGDRVGYVTYKLTKSDNTQVDVKCKTLWGVEMPTEYIWHISDDLLEYNDGTTSKAYWCSDPTKYQTPSDNDAESWAAEHGYEYIADLPMTSGYVKNESMNVHGLSLPATLTIGSGQVGDYYYHGNGTGWFGSLFGGCAPVGASAGFGFLLAHYRPALTGASVGARLCRN